MEIRAALLSDLAALLALRLALWPDHTASEHEAEVRHEFSSPDWTVFLACAADGEAIGFAEASIRRDPVNGCSTSPVAFLEGLYVEPAHRRGGAARRLVGAVEAWAARSGLQELASDADLDNLVSHQFHEAFGFEETERAVYFRKQVTAP